MDPITLILLGVGGYVAYRFVYAPKKTASNEVPPGMKLDPNKKGTGFEDDPLSKTCSGDVDLRETDVLYPAYVGAFTSDGDPDSLMALADLLDESCHATAANTLREKAKAIAEAGPNIEIKFPGSDVIQPACTTATPLLASDPLYDVYEAALVSSTSLTALESAAALLDANCHPVEAKSLRDKADVLKTFGASTAGVDFRRYGAMSARASGR